MVTKIAALSLAVTVSVAGCHSFSRNAASDAVKIVSVPDVARFVKDKSAAIFDANGTDTRQKYGVVPGAILLTDNKTYPLSELPAEKSKKLVFYCGGTMCRASDAAAERAAGAGYTNVAVMRDGIKGWAGAGQATSIPQS